MQSSEQPVKAGWVYGTTVMYWLSMMSAQPMVQGQRLPSGSKCERWHQKRLQYKEHDEM